MRSSNGGQADPLQTIADLRNQIDALEHLYQKRYYGPKVAHSPIRQPVHVTLDSGTDSYLSKMLVGTATTGTVRFEWIAARDNLLVPPNYANVRMWQPMSSFAPIRFQVDDAQNLIVKAAVEGDFEWLLLYEHDVLPPHNALRTFDEHIRNATAPIISGLYYTRSRPSEPLIYRGRGTGSFMDWEYGDLVWCDGVPTGFLLIHGAILRAMWQDAEPYIYQFPNNTAVELRRVFWTPREISADPDGGIGHLTGTSDLDWCTRVMNGGYFGKAGWPEFDDEQYPFLVDTSIFCRHINPDGTQFP